MNTYALQSLIESVHDLIEITTIRAHELRTRVLAP